MQKNQSGVLTCTIVFTMLTTVLGQASLTTLAGGQYMTTTNVLYHSAFTKDVKAMRKALAAEDYDLVKNIYEHGENVFGLDELGNRDIGNIKSLQSLSTIETEFMTSEITFNIYTYGFLPLINNFYKGDSKEQYADAAVNFLFDLGSVGYGKAIDASIILNLWMAVIHMLNLSVDSCKEVYENPSTSHDAHPSEYVDVAAAYWIGLDVDPELNFAGSLLYKITDEMALRFNQDFGEASVNKAMIDFFNAMQQTSVLCAIEERVSQHMRILKDEIIKIMTIPLIQNLIYHIELDNAAMVGLYAVSIVPQISSCDPKAAQFFLDNFVWNEYKSDVKDQALKHLGNTFKCLDLSCDDVGKYFGRDLLNNCSENEIYAGYKPASLSPLLPEVSEIDIDISQLQAFISLGAYDAAFDLFQYGRNSYSLRNSPIFKIGEASYHSLNGYSIPSRKTALFQRFSAFHKADDFAREEMYKMLDKDGLFRYIPDEGRSIIAAKFTQYITMFYASLEYLSIAQNLCYEGKAQEAVKNWDFAAVTLVGSIENSDVRTDQDGYLIYNVLKNMCDEFKTCYYVNENDPRSLVSFLSNGLISITTGSCDKVESNILDITSILEVALVQSSFHYLQLLDLKENRNWQTVGSWYISLLSICPLINGVDEEVADIFFRSIKSVLSEKFDISVHDYGSRQLMQKLKEIVPQLKSLDCTDVGKHEDILDMCILSPVTTSKQMNTSSPTAKGTSTPSISLRDTSTPTAKGTSTPSISLRDTSTPTTKGTSTPSISLRDTPSPSVPTLIETMTPTARKAVIEEENAPTMLDLSKFGIDMNEILEETPDLKNFVKISKDIEDIEKSDDVAIAQDIYKNGKNSIYTLQSLSLESTTDMVGERTFNFYKHFFQFQSGDGMFDDEQIDFYADSVVNDFFNIELISFAATTMKTMHVWMEIVHNLEVSVSACKDASSQGSVPSAISAINTALALWFGAIEEDNPIGNLLYEMTEKIRVEFERSAVNRELIKLLVKAKNDFFADDHCVNDPTAWVRLRVLKNGIVSKMTIPLIQYLIDNIINGRSAQVELYTVAVGPLIAACSPNVKDFLIQNTIEQTYNPEMRDEFLSNLQSVYNCLGITCEDVGDYKSFDLNCSNKPIKQEMAGFLPYTDVREAADIDLDILQMKILMEAGAIDSSRDLYLHGHNSLSRNGYNSLFDITNIDYSNESEQYKAFSRFYGKDNYADRLIQEEIDNSEVDQTYEMSSKIVSSLAQSMIMYMRPLQLMYSSLQLCKDGNSVASLASWNDAAANLLGSIVGTTSRSVIDDEGTLMYSVLKKTCAMFDTCFHTDPTDGRSIGREMNLANEYANTGACPALEESLKVVVSKLQAALVQSTIHYASLLESDSSSNESINGFRIASGMAVIPLVAVGERLSAEKIRSMIDDPEKVDLNIIVGAFKRAVPIMTGLKCEDVGKIFHYGGFCLGDTMPSEVNNANSDMDETANSIQEVEISEEETDFNNDATSNEDDTPIDNDNDSPGSEVLNDSVGATNIEQTVFPFNRYPVDDDTWELSKLSLDVKKMKQTSNVIAAFQTYYEGTQIFSLESLSINATEFMYDEAIYCAYREALWEYLRGPAWYANTITEKFFEVSITIGVESSIVMNLWMYIIHLLNNAIEDCESDEIVFESIDIAFSLWVGFEQEEGTANGYLLYSIAELAEENFEVNAKEKEAKANTKLISLFNEARDLLNSNGTCVENDGTSFRKTVFSIQSTMAIPLIQNLIHYLREGEESYTSLYAYAIVPMLYAYNRDAYRNLEELFFEGTTDDVDKAIRAIESSYNALGISCEEVGSHIDTLSTCDNGVSIVGFIAPTEARKQAQIDLDILQISILLSWGKINGAKDIYLRGRNSLDPSGNIQSLAGLLVENNANEEILIGILFDFEPIGNITLDQTAELSTNTFQTMFTLTVVPQMLDEVLALCMEDKYFDSGSKLTEVSAYLIGSLEGTARGGSPTSAGVLFYSLAKQMCVVFGTCAPSGDAMVNEKLLELLGTVQSSIAKNERCVDVIDDVENLKKTLLVPIIQGILHNSLLLEEEKSIFPMNETDSINYTTSKSLIPAYVFTSGILPLINNMSSANILRTNLIEPVHFGGDVLPDGPTEIYKVFQVEIDALGISCEDIGEHIYGSLCSLVLDDDDDDTNIDISEATSLSNGLYITTTNVGDRHKIAQDVQDIKNALDSGDIDLAQSIYNQGLNAWKYDNSGIRTNEKWSLKEYSTTAGKTMEEDPVFNTYLYALRDNSGNFLGKNVDLYADTFVLQSFNQGTLAAEAVVVLNLWMTVVHKVYASVRVCKSKMNDSSNENEGVHVLDEAVAYWIGHDQKTGLAYEGNLLYALTEDMGVRFNQDDGGQSIVNKRVLKLFNEAKDQITFSNTCTLHSGTHVKLKRIADELVSVMSIPLLQGLIFYMNKENAQGTKLYALAFIPMLAGCSPQIYEILHDKLIVQSYQSSMYNEVVSLIQTCYPCLGLTCDDVGYYSAGNSYKCSNPLVRNPIAGYIPTTDVRDHAKIDLDMLQMKILMDMKAYDAAGDLYTMGKNGKDELTLYFFASKKYRENVPQYITFNKYFGDLDYADTIVSRAITGVEPYREVSTEMRSAIVADTLKSMVMYMRVLSLMYKAIENCKGKDFLAVPNPWDAAIASLIGSMEGSDKFENLRNPGLFLFGLSQRRCAEFGTCDSDGISNVNKRILVLAYAGQSQYSIGQCEKLAETVKEMDVLMQVPLIQSTLKFAVSNDGLTFDSGAASLGSGFAYSRSILPLIDDVDKSAADVLENNMDFRSVRDRKPIHQGASSVFNAIAEAIPKLDGIDCREISGINRLSVCEAGKDLSTSFTYNDDETDNEKLRNATIIALKTAIPISVVLLILFIGMCTWNRKGKKEEIDLENIKESDLQFDTGESNHKGVIT